MLFKDPSVRFHSAIANLLWDNSYPYPPGYFLASLVLYPFHLLNERFCAFATHAHFLLLIIVTAHVSYKLSGATSGALAAIVTTFTPAFSAFSRDYMIDLPLTFWVVMAYNFLIPFSLPIKLHRIVGLGLTCGIGLLYKQSYPIYVLPGLLIVGYRQGMLLKLGSRAQLLKPLLTFLLVLSALTLPYYGTHLTHALTLVSSFKTVLEKSPVGAIGVPKIMLLYLLDLPKMLSLSFLIPSILAGLLTFSKAQCQRTRLLQFWAIIPLPIISALFPVMNWRYILPALPAFIIWQAMMMTEACSKLKMHLNLGYIVGGLSILGLAHHYHSEDLQPKLLHTKGYYDRIYTFGATHPAAMPLDLSLLLKVLDEIDRQSPIKRIAVLPNIPLLTGVMVAVNEHFQWNPNRFDFVIGGKLDNGIINPETYAHGYWQKRFASFDAILSMDTTTDFTDGRHQPGSTIFETIVRPAIHAAKQECERRPLALKLPILDGNGCSLLVYSRISNKTP